MGNNTISLSRHEQVSSIRLQFKRYFSHHQATNDYVTYLKEICGPG